MTKSTIGSRHHTGSRSGRSHRSRTSLRHQYGAQSSDVLDTKPNIDEVRDKRVAYYGTDPRDRKGLYKATVLKARSEGSKAADTAVKPTEQKHRTKRSSKSGTGKTAKKQSISEQRTEDFVYNSVTPASRRDEGDDDDDHDSSSETEGRPSRNSYTSRRHGLTTINEAEVTPDDSVSQVGRRRVKRTSLPSTLRPPLRRSNTTSSKLAPVTERVIEGASSPAGSRTTSKREPSLLGSLLRRHSTTSASALPRLVDCLTCGSDDIPRAQSAKLTCGHRMCHDCLKRVFEMSIKDPAHMPPRCCTQDIIPLKHVDALFDTKFKMLWNRKYQEYHTKDRIYCPSPKCGHWIKPKHFHTSQGRKYAHCPRCQTKVCTQCNNKLHKSRDCPKDPAITKLIAKAKEEGWQSCYNCNAMVELKEGCNHMTCRCTAEFCMICGAKWKTCDCAWFNYNQLQDFDRLNHMRVPEPIQNIFDRVLRAGAGAVPPPQRPAAQAAGAVPLAAEQAAPRRARQNPTTYEEEMAQRRRQERLDAALARRLQLASLFEPEEGEPARRAQADVETWGVGDAAGHFLNDDFVQNAANVVMSAFGDTNMGRRGDRASGRRRRARESRQHGNEAGLAPNFLGDESVLGAGPSNRTPTT